MGRKKTNARRKSQPQPQDATPEIKIKPSAGRALPDCRDLVLSYLKSLNSTQLRDLFAVEVSTIKKHFSTYPEASKILSNALSFPETSGSLTFHVCFICNDSFSDLGSFMRHSYEKHVAHHSSEFELIPFRSFNASWIGVIFNGCWKPMEVPPAVEMLQEQPQCRCGLWPMSDDPERAMLLEGIQICLRVLLMFNLLCGDQLDHLLQLATSAVENHPCGSTLLNIGGKNLPPHVFICLLGAKELESMLTFLEEVLDSCDLSRPSEADSFPDDAVFHIPGNELVKRACLSEDSLVLVLKTSFADNDEMRGVNADAVCSWLYNGTSMEESLCAFEQVVNRRRERASKIHDALSEKVLLLNSLKVKKWCLETTKKTKNEVEPMPQQLKTTLTNWKKMLAEMAGRKNDAVLAIVSATVRELEEENEADKIQESDIDDDYDSRMQDDLDQEKSHKTMLFHRQNELFNIRLDKINARIMNNIASLHEIERKFGSVSTVTYLTPLIPLVKSFLQVSIEDAAEKSAKEKAQTYESAEKKAQAAYESLMAEENNARRSTKRGGSDKKQAKKKFKDKKDKDPKKFKGRKNVGCSGQFLPREASEQQEVLPATDGNVVKSKHVTRGSYGKELEDEHKAKIEIDNACRKLDGTLNHQGWIENETKEPPPAEQKRTTTSPSSAVDQPCPGYTSWRKPTVENLQRCKNIIQPYLDYLSPPEHFDLFVARVSDIKEHFSSMFEESKILSEALSFLEARGSWLFWNCFPCGDIFVDFRSFMQHLLEGHLEIGFPALELILHEMLTSCDSGMLDAIPDDPQRKAVARVFLDRDSSILVVETSFPLDQETWVPDADTVVSWLYDGPSPEESVLVWTQMIEGRKLEYTKILDMLMKKVKLLNALYSQKLNALQLVAVSRTSEMFCLELKKWANDVEHMSEELRAALMKWAEELVEMADRKNGIVLDAISAVLKELVEVNEDDETYESDNNEVEDCRMQDCLDQESRITTLFQKQNELNNMMIDKIDVKITKNLACSRELVLKLDSVSVLDYLTVLIPLVKSFLQVTIKDAAEKYEIDRVQPSCESLIAAQNDAQKITKTGSNSKSQAKKKLKGKKKGKYPKKFTGRKNAGCSEQCLPKEASEQQEVLAATDGNLVKTEHDRKDSHVKKLEEEDRAKNLEAVMPMIYQHIGDQSDNVTMHLEASSGTSRAQENLSGILSPELSSSEDDAVALTNDPVSSILIAKDFLGTGLKNEVGEHNCFLNAVIQSLWHIRRFQEEFHRTFLMHKHFGNPCVTCTLYAVFVDLIKSSEKAMGEPVDPAPLRLALNNLDHCKFQMAMTGDACEVLEEILNCLHESFTSSSDCNANLGDIAGYCESNNCIAHALFGMEHRSESKNQKYTSFHHLTYADEFRRMKNKYADRSFDEPLKDIEIDRLPSEADAKSSGKPDYIGARSTPPHIFTTVLVWQSGNEDAKKISATLDAITTEVDIGALYSGFDQGRKHHLVAVVCYHQLHYICFAYGAEHGNWIMYDDQTIKVFGSWNEVCSLCKREKLQPTILFFEAVQ